MKLIDANHIRAHLRCVKQIALDNANRMSPQELSAFGDAIGDAEKIVDKVTSE